MFWDLIFYIGMYHICWWIYRWVSLFHRTQFGVKASTQRYGKDSWAVVTGSTDGIGKAQAFHLARLGFNIVLISTSLEQLNKVALELQEIKVDGVPTKTRVIVNDFSKDFSAAVFEKMYKEKLSDIDISILSNNVGMAGLNHFDKMTDQEVHNMVSVNCYPVVLLTKQIIKSF